MFEDDDFDLDLSDPLLDITNGSVSQNPRVNSDKSFQFKCPTNPNRHVNVHPVETEEVANVLTTTTTGKQIFDNIKSNVSDEISHKEKEKGRGEVSSFLMSENSRRNNTHRFESTPSNSHEDLISKKRRSSDFAGGRQRRFPGPAGVLERQPPLPGDKRPIPLDPEGAGNGDQGRGEREALLEEDILGDLDECVVWSRALEDLSPILNSEQITKYNTSWIKKQSSGNIVPYFLCKIVKLDLSTKDPVVVLADKLGTIVGNLHRDVVETCGRDVKVGTVMLVVRAAVLRTVKVDYLNITLHNVVSVYSKSDVQRLQTHSKEDFSKLDTFIQQRSERRPEASGSGVMNMQPSGESNRRFPLAPSDSNSRFPNAPPSKFPTASSSNNARFPSTALSSIPSAPAASSNISMRLPSASAASISGSRLPPANSSSSSSSQMPGLPSSQQTGNSGRSKFTFKSTAAPPRPSAAPPRVSMLPGSPAPESQAALQQTPAESQHLVASLLSDLDSSDIWADF